MDLVYEACARTAAAVHRPVNPTILTPAEFPASFVFLDNVRGRPDGRRDGGARAALTPLTRVQRATVLVLAEARCSDVVRAGAVVVGGSAPRPLVTVRVSALPGNLGAW